MEETETLKWTGVYLGLWLVATAVAAAIIVGGIALGGLRAIGLYHYTPFGLRLAVYPRAGLGVILLGLVAWKFGTAAALFRTFATIVELETARQLDTEVLKSDILSVMDDRLADMHQEIGATRRLVDRLSRSDAADDFEFDLDEE